MQLPTYLVEREGREKVKKKKRKKKGKGEKE